MSQLLDMIGTVEVVPEIDGGDLFPLDLSTLAVSSLIDEAELTPKPALVDRRGNGAHHDLDLTRLRRSAQSLQDGFAAIARAADGEEPSLRLREELGGIGRDMERGMLVATDGSNAHRGAIWALGLLVAAAARRRSETNATRIATAAAALARTGMPTPARRATVSGPAGDLARPVLAARRRRHSRMRSASACRHSARRVAVACLRTVRDSTP